MTIIPMYLIITTIIFLFTFSIGVILFLYGYNVECIPRCGIPTMMECFGHIIFKLCVIYSFIIYPMIFAWVLLTRISYFLNWLMGIIFA